jgi:predicted nucleic acid-binding protein
MEKLKIYLDNCCYNRPFDIQEQDIVRLETQAKLAIQRKIKEGIYALVWSFMSDAENDDNLSEEKRKMIEPWRNIAQDYCSSSEAILEKSREFMKLGMRHKDAIHLACAVCCACDYMITTDKKFLNKNKHVSEIEIVNPVTFLLKMEELDEN